MSDNANDARTMADVSHTNPYTGETTGRLFSRGPTVAADGGERTDGSRSSSERRSDGGRPADAEADETDDGTAERKRDTTMADVDHTPPHDAEDANRVFERGQRNPVDPVEDEE
ncbi:hypothetical protein [Halopiger aswanensis]|uniref:Uncharacterized protein n=1 Tax=Halopiger aswanensis TaxID=148449 RepID=A0A419WRJ4_9EURY|nr:hypothetical protein [Halopiger aswanensis]RKD98028.1 hypothetical protein ATJ93_1028 [Halopiger aswanensis]